MFSGKNVLITGGTGSFGKKFVQRILKEYPDVKKLIIYSRDELKQYEMSQTFSPKEYPCLRYFIGDVRDSERMIMACEGVDIIIHAAALKQVPAAEYNPMECIKTNIMGAENVIKAALACRAEHVVALSTDKAAAPINLYGATKLCSDKLFVAANNMKGDRDIKFSVVRYGNVFGSRGSVIPFFLGLKDAESLPITHKEMTRFNITLDEGVDLVFYALKNAWGGEIFIPKIPSYKILDIASAINPKAKLNDIGVRAGEKIHEEMITSTDSLNTMVFDKHFVIAPSTPTWEMNDYLKKFDGKMAEQNFQYNSGSNDSWLSIDDIRKLIVEQCDPNFTV